MRRKTIEKRHLLIVTLLFGLLPLSTSRTSAQQDTKRFRVVVNLVQLNVAVTDNKGNYVQGLHPQDFVVTEDSIPENIATFEEGNAPPTRLLDKSLAAQGRPRTQDSVPGASLQA